MIEQVNNIIPFPTNIPCDKDFITDYKIYIYTEKDDIARLYYSCTSIDEAFKEAMECIPDKNSPNVEAENASKLKMLEIVEEIRYKSGEVYNRKPIMKWVMREEEGSV